MGSLVGVLLGATSVGAPLVILYLLSGPDPQVVTRANLTVFVTAISVTRFGDAGRSRRRDHTLSPPRSRIDPVLPLTTWLGGKLFARDS